MNWLIKLKRVVRKESSQSIELPAEISAPEPTDPAPSHDERLTILTKREREVFNLLVQGKKMQEVADALGVKLTTISFHSTAMYKKLDVHNRAQLILRYGLAQSVQKTESIKGVDSY